MRTYLMVAALFCTVAAGPAAAQTAQGRAFGTTLDLLGATLIDQSDTQTRNAPNPANLPNPNGFTGTAAGATVPLAPIAEVITGPSITRGCAIPGACPELFSAPAAGFTPLDPSLSNETFTRSVAGDATASVLIDAANGDNLLDAVSNGAEISVRCNNDVLGSVTPQASGSSRIDALVIAGSPVTIPGSVDANTTILASQFPLLILNEQDCGVTSTTATCSVTALHAQILPLSGLGLVDLKLSNASGTITFDPATCVCGGPILKVVKTANVLTAGGTAEDPPIPNPGDQIRYTIRVSNNGCLAATGAVAIDRLPSNATVVPSTLPSGTATGICPGSAPPSCPGSGSTNTCLRIPLGTIPVGSTIERTFNVTVNADAGCGPDGTGFPICNSVNATADGGISTLQASQAFATCPEGPPGGGGGSGGSGGGGGAGGGGGGGGAGGAGGSGGAGGAGGSGGAGGNGDDLLRTTGGGGCSLGGASTAAGSEMFPVLTIGLLLAVRQWRRRASRADGE